jgi:hypothetical protein
MMTIDSILNQTALVEGRHELQLILVCSETPDSLVKEAMEKSTSIHAMTDAGMGLYAALAESFRRHAGDVNGYLGVGDCLEPQTFQIIAELSSLDWIPRPHWFTGIIVGRRNDGAIVRSTQPPAISRAALLRGRAGRLTPGLQQESTFWDSELHKEIDLADLGRYRLAGDLSLWRQFARTAQPITVEAALASFRWHGDNMSQDWSGYLAESETIFGKVNLVDKIWAARDKFVWALPTRIKRRLGGRSFVTFSWPHGPWE